MLQLQELWEVGVLVLSVKMADEQAECLLSARHGHTPQQLQTFECYCLLGTDSPIVQTRKLRLGGTSQVLTAVNPLAQLWCPLGGTPL